MATPAEIKAEAALKLEAERLAKQVKATQIEQSYARAKAKYDAQKSIQLKESAESLAMQLKTSNSNLALQNKQLGQFREQATVGAAQQGSQAYVNAQQQARVLPNQLTQAGLGQSGYRSLAQQKMAQDLNKNQKGIKDNLGQQMAGYQRNEESNKLNYNQNVEGSKLNYNQNIRSANNAYSQNIADLNLDKKERLVNLEAQTATNTGGQVPTGYTPVTSGGSSKPPTTINFVDMVKLANSGQYTYDQYKLMLKSSGISSAEQTAYLKNFLYYQAKRETPSTSGKVPTRPGEQYQ